MTDEKGGSNVNISLGRGNTGQIAAGDNITQVSGGSLVTGETGERAGVDEAKLPEAIVAQRLRLARALERAYNLDELQRLCMLLNVNYENIPGETLSAKASGLVDYLTRRERLDELEAALRRERPGLLD